MSTTVVRSPQSTLPLRRKLHDSAMQYSVRVRLRLHARAPQLVEADLLALSKRREFEMAWKPQPRFNLLLLENGEYFLEVKNDAHA